MAEAAACLPCRAYAAARGKALLAAANASSAARNIGVHRPHRASQKKADENDSISDIDLTRSISARRSGCAAIGLENILAPALRASSALCWRMAAVMSAAIDRRRPIWGALTFAARKKQRISGPKAKIVSCGRDSGRGVSQLLAPGPSSRWAGPARCRKWLLPRTQVGCSGQASALRLSL